MNENMLFQMNSSKKWMGIYQFPMSKSNLAASTTITMKKTVLFHLQRKLDQDGGTSKQKRRKEDEVESDTKVCKVTQVCT